MMLLNYLKLLNMRHFINKMILSVCKWICCFLLVDWNSTSLEKRSKADSMDSGSKGGVDQISGLPDDILCHILSFLPTKYAVATSILSTRWKYVWSSVPILDFNASLHRDFFPFLNFYGSKQSEISFRRFVNRVLLLNDAHIKKFRLIYERHYIAAPIHTWLHLAISRDILELELDFNMSVPKESIKCLRNLFMSNTLVVLKLSRMPLIVPSVVCFPMLKVLEIRRVIYLDDICTRNLLLGCQVLEELVIEEIIRERPRVIDISIPTLKKFSFSYKFVTDISTDCPYRFVFNAPNLQYFHVKGRISDDFDVKSLASFVDVHLDLRETAVLAENYNQCHQRICDFFKELANANSLILSSDIVELFCTVADPNLPRFYNMKNLGLGINYNPDFCWKRLVKEFIKCSPDLDALTLYNKQGILRDIEELRRNPPKAVPDHLLSYLKEVFIQELYSNFLPEDVECLVQDMKVLKQLKINCQCPIILVIQIGYTAQVK